MTLSVRRGPAPSRQRPRSGKAWTDPTAPGRPPPTSSSGRAFAEVGLADAVIAEERVRPVAHDDLAGLQDVAARGQPQRLRRVLLDEEHGRPLVVDLLDDVEDPR